MAEAQTQATGGGGQASGAPGSGGGGGGGEPFYQPFLGALDRDTLAYLDGKKYPSFSDFAKSARESERMARERNVIAAPDPQKLDDWEGWSKLGWDADRGKYGAKIKPPKMPNDGPHDAELMDFFVSTAHAERLPPDRVERLFHKLSDKVNERLSVLASTGRKAMEEFESRARAEEGADYDANTELGRRAARAFAIGADDSSELERIFGNGDANKGALRLRKFFVGLGKKLGEGNLVTADGLGGSAGTTPATAMAEARRLEGDEAFMKIFRDARHPQHEDYKARYMRLMEIAAKDPNNVSPPPRRMVRG